MKVRNTFIIFLVSGFWHGANWTFIVWGFLNALYFLPLLLSNKNRDNLDIIAKGKTFPSAKEFAGLLITFSLTVFAWIFFRAESVSQAFSYIGGIFTSSLFSIPQVSSTVVWVLIAIFLAIEWNGREQQYAIANFAVRWPRLARWSIYYFMALAIYVYAGKGQQFIYFQF